ncbi:MAG: hypothetical protein HY303_07780, partial [Candidatus Wallbacteria bacterium]|nr:hypothetical protein [Candidatus Wallbacteria bacterium]
PIAEFGAVRQLLGDSQSRCLALALHWRRLGWLKDSGAQAVLESSIAKLTMSEDCLRVSDQAVQVHGGYGYIREYPVEQAYRDVKLYTLGGGTSEIQQRIILDIVMKDYQEGRFPARVPTGEPFLTALAGAEQLARIAELRVSGRGSSVSLIQGSLRHGQPEIGWAIAMDELAAQDRLESFPSGPASGPVPPRVRIRAAACACGFAARLLERGLLQAVELRQAHPGQELQELLFPLARMRAEIDTARLLTWRAAQAADLGLPETAALAAAARLRAADAATQALLRVSDLCGAEPALARLFHTVASLRIAGGADATLREELASFAITQAQC